MLGLILEGGGGKGAYQIGAYKALMEMGYKFDGVAGTSIGAVNGAFIAQGDYEKIKYYWTHINDFPVIAVDSNIFIEYMEKGLTKNVLKYIGKNVLSINEAMEKSAKNFHDILAKYIDEDKVRKSKLDYGLVTMAVNQLEPYELLKEDIPEGQLVDYVMASACFPAFKLHEIDGKKFIDGGIYDNTPINVLARKGYENLIIIKTSTKELKRPIIKKDLNLKFIVPSEPLGNVTTFSQKTAFKNMKLGYYDAYKTMQNLKGKYFYIKPFDEEQIIIPILKMPNQFFIEVCKLIKENYPGDKMGAYKIILDYMRKHIDNCKGKKDSDCILTVYEMFAKALKLSRWSIYSLENMNVELMLKLFDKDSVEYHKCLNLEKYIKKQPFVCNLIKCYLTNSGIIQEEEYEQSITN